MSDYTSAKFISKQLKAKGLQKLRFYCQVCHKQCRDSNGFQSHIKSPSHLKRISQVTQADIDQYTSAFQQAFLKLLRVSHGEKPVEVNKFYNEYIQDKDHVHMNATRFTSLTKFVQHLGTTGEVRVQGLEDGGGVEGTTSVYISYVDRSSANTVLKQQLQDLEAHERRDQTVKQLLLQRQIARGKQNSTDSETSADTTQEDPASTRQLPPTIQIPLTKKRAPHKIAKNKKRRNVFD
ncbi:Rts2p KNAG_0L01980 [Huiozyma naganishii CBS 8797]|uniref:C2H2-type domain-containing protein n=1 Tax=Huiozyma naganishii (strain ATCC MYA-139 / BCRC 22969 / CBS 8797 / KCTC 17520 / NBRC 10181 / NCYC 3082 / Yp74L-3) TaxID=1071383 RepID=J7S3T9_HUIN7|nr:hypothetical protein KNAG_0L01980 [Kazachstania naganishii CBS 8797]CCK72817.1 hypothetical protein KNAG_0L01980 [Kazachstania naganishii CBS 8797]